jgi:hypothetical protein
MPGNAAFPDGHCRSTGTPPSQAACMPARMPAIPCRRSHAGDPNGITYNLPEHGNAAFPDGHCRSTGTPPSQAACMPARMPAIPCRRSQRHYIQFAGARERRLPRRPVCRQGCRRSQRHYMQFAGARERRLPRRPVCRQGCRRSHAGDPNGITYNLPEHGNAAFPGGLYAGKDAGDPMPAIPTALHTICRSTGTPPSQAACMPARMPAIPCRRSQRHTYN